MRLVEVFGTECPFVVVRFEAGRAVADTSGATSGDPAAVLLAVSDRGDVTVELANAVVLRLTSDAQTQLLVDDLLQYTN